MYVRPLCIAVTGYVLGILAISTDELWYYILIAGIFLGLAVNWIKVQNHIWACAMLVLYTLSTILGVWRCQSEQEFTLAYESVIYDDMQMILQGKLEEKELKNNIYLYYLKDCYLVLEQGITPCNQIIVEMEQDDAHIGEILILEGNIALFPMAVNEGNFDAASFYKSQGIAFKLINSKIKEIHGEKDVFREKLYALKQQIKHVYKTCMSEETSGVLSVMALGDKSLLDSDIKELYQNVGISHILAISGLHISIIGMTLYRILRKWACSFWFAGICAGSFMLSYGCMTGFRPSTVRALVMFIMMLFAQIIGRSYDSLSALSLSATVQLWQNPYLLQYAGFLFSYMAVIGVVLFGKSVIRCFEEEGGSWKRIRDLLYNGFSIQFLTVPLTAYFYYEIPLYGMFTNFLVLPLMSILLSMGVIGGMAGCFNLTIAIWILFPCQMILKLYQIISEIMQNMPYSLFITGRPEPERMAIYYGALAIMLYVIWRRKKAFGYLGAGVALLAFVLYVPKTGMELTMLDVGQGEGIYIHTSSNYDLFIDGGSTSVSRVGTYRIWPYLKYKGVREIDYWFISHVDEDHVSGVNDILEADYKVKYVVFSENVVRDESYLELVELVERNGAEVIQMGYLDTLHLGEVDVTCAFPYEEFTTTDKNASSLVLYYQDRDFEALFTGDIGKQEEKWMIGHGEWLKDCFHKNGEEEIRIDLYKVAHHGSKYSNSNEMIEWLNPKIALISSGLNNRYGHPHTETLERLDDAGCEILNTAKSGQVTIKADGDIVVLVRPCLD